MPTTISFNFKMNLLSCDLLFAFDSSIYIENGIENGRKSDKFWSILAESTPEYSPPAAKPQLALYLWICIFATCMLLHLFRVEKNFLIEK